MNGARGDPSAGLIRRLFRRGGVEAAPPSPDEARVIAVASGKGGTGKSFVATGLAVALARRNRVILVDCDYGLGNDHLLLGVSPERTLQDVLGRRVRALDAVVDTGLGPGLLPGGSGVTTMTELSDDELGALARALGDVARACDVLILDLAAGISAQSLLTMLAADEIVLVTNPEIAALTDAYALVKCLSRQVVQPPVGVVVNRVAVGEPELGQRTFLKLAEVAQRFSGYSIHSWVRSRTTRR